MPVNLSDLSAAAVTTESDVEQKIILPLLTAAEWLAVPDSAIRTKHYLPPTTIDKGAGRRTGYFPDYSVWIDGLPILIIEAKSPLESVTEGFREAQLYAHEVNKAYPSGINPLCFVLASNGKSLLVGNWDAQPTASYEISDLRLGNRVHSTLREKIGIQALKAAALATRQKFRPTLLFRPIDFIGGDATLNKRIGFNSFATDLAVLIRMFFVSDTAERLDDIIERAYVSSDEITKYDQLLETFLKERVELLAMPGSKAIETSKKRESALTEQIRHFAATLPTTGQIQLLIGPVGAGKSLFCQRYYRFLRSADVKKNSIWAFIDFNTAPDDLQNAEDWVCSTFVESLTSYNPEFDVYLPDNLKRIFAPDIQKFRKIYASVLACDQAAFDTRLADQIAEWVASPQKFAKAISRFVLGDQRKVLAVVFDNVDRRDREQQLRIFQIAQWFRNATRAFCLLALRDETYEQYKTEPPLDAFINAIHFTISPPRFIDVVRKRMELAIEHLAHEAPDKISYELPDGKRISYPATRLGQYLKTLYIDIFRGSRKISWVLEALSGRDVRRSLEMFTRILMSGHLDERRVTGTMLGTVQFVIPESLIIRILMKTDYMYFLEGHGFVANILYTDPQWKRPSNLLVVELLESVVSRRKQRGELGIQGFFRVEGIIRDLARMGFYDDDVMAALKYMLRSRLITADHMGRSRLAEGDHVRAHASGLAHLRFLASRLDYLVGILPSTYLVDRRLAEAIGRRSAVSPGYTDISMARKREILRDLVNYLKDEFNRHAAESPFYEGLATGGRLLIRYAEEALNTSAGRRSADRQISDGLH